MTATVDTIRAAIARNKNLAYIVGLTETISPLGKQCLLDSPWLTERGDMAHEYSDTDEMLRHISLHDTKIDKICLQLMCLRDVASTLSALAAGQVLGDIELYEVKALALTVMEVRRICLEIGLAAVELPSVANVVDALDPEGTRVAHFYVYDAYSTALKDLRGKLKQARKEEADNVAELFAACSDEETRIRIRLSAELQPYAPALTAGLKDLGRLDMLIARARLVKKLSLTRPQIAEAGISYTALRNPQIAEALKQSKREFQPVDISAAEGVTVITGANMAGKSVVLKTVGLAQLMAQFGYFVPADKACITPVQEVLSSIGDAQDELEGLSSYAAEMLRINEIIKKKRNGMRLLALIDEPARTTNPEEGKALVNAVIELLSGPGSYTLLTTHYSGLTAPCRRLRVRGFREEKADGRRLTAATVNDFIDYTLEPSNETEVPREALRIAMILGVDDMVTDTAARYLDR